MSKSQQYLLDLSYIGWHKVSDIPKDIAIEVIELIDENYHCSYLMNDNWDEFKKVSKDSGKPGNYKPKDSYGRTK